MSKVTIKTDFGLSKNLNKIRRSFKRQSCPLYEKTIKRDIAAGVSPVRGQRLFKKYSQSYKDGIRGKVKFRTINGRVIPMAGPDPRLKGKALSPVNLKLTGKMMRSLFCRVNGNRTNIGFKSKIADFHNRLGIPRKSGINIVRRMLPTNRGEDFNRSIEIAIQRLLDTIVRRFINK